MQSNEIFKKAVTIQATPSEVWDTLTNPVLMKKWMFETDIEIITDWKTGSPIIIRGDLHGMDFVNNGTVLAFEEGKRLQYNHLNSLSKLSDDPENYSIIEFILSPIENQTVLTLTLSNFPTEEIYRHLAFYWNVTLEILKKQIELSRL